MPCTLFQPFMLAYVCDGGMQASAGTKLSQQRKKGCSSLYLYIFKIKCIGMYTLGIHSMYT